MYLKISLSLFLICWISGSSAGNNVRFPNDDESDKGGGMPAEERYSDNQASSVVMQPNGVKRLQPHFIIPQVPSGQNPFGHVNPGGYSEGIILSQPSGRPPNRHIKPNTKIPEKMKQIQRHPYRVISKPPPGQLQTRKPLFVPKGGSAPPPKDTRNHPEAIKHKIKHPYFNKEQEFHHLHKPEIVGLSEKELTKLKGNKYYIKGPHPHSETPHPYKFLPTLPPHEVNQNYEKLHHKENKHHKDKYIHSTPQYFSSYQPHGEYPQYHEHQNYKEPDNLKNSFNKPFIPVQEHIEEPSYLNKKDGFPNYYQQGSFYNDNQKKIHPGIESLEDYINKWTSTKKYETKYTPFKEWGDLDEPNFEKAWLSASEWVPIHAPAPALIQENLQTYPNYDSTFAASNNFALYPDTATITNNPFINRQGYSDQLQYSPQTFSNSLSSQASTVTNSFTRPQTEHTINPFDLRSQIFQKPEVVIGKRPKSADVNNSHEVSAVFMVKQ